jgi:hypothetical protein
MFAAICHLAMLVLAIVAGFACGRQDRTICRAQVSIARKRRCRDWPGIA